MEWPQLKEHLRKNNAFIERVDVSSVSSDITDSIHPIIDISTCFAIRAMSNRTDNRLVIIVPTLLNCARWITALCVLDRIREEFENDPSSLKFNRGQKLLVSRYTVEYCGDKYIPEYKKLFMLVKCRDGHYWIPYDRAVALQAIDTDKPLSSMEKVGGAIGRAQKLANPVDSILGLHTMGNKTMFEDVVILVSKIGETERFIRDKQFNYTEISKIFFWGKLDSDGRASVIGPYQLQGTPSCVVSSDLLAANRFVGNNEKHSKAVIIDGLANCVNNLKELDGIIDRDVPVIILADRMDTENISHFVERDFKIWQWNKNNIDRMDLVNRDTPQLSPFYALDHTLSNYRNLEINTVVCEYTELDNAVLEIFKLDSMIPHDDRHLSLLYGKLIRTVNGITRLIRIPDESWSAGIIERMDVLQRQFEDQKTWLSEDALQAVRKIFNSIRNLARDPFPGENHKPDQLSRIIKDGSPSENIAVVVLRPMEIESLKEYWGSCLPAHKMENIGFFTLSDILDNWQQFSPDRIIICGWLGKGKMYTILHSYITSAITVLLYPSEYSWFKSATKRWESQNNFMTYAKDFSILIGVPEKELGIIEFEPPKITEAVGVEDNSFEDFELKLKKYQYQSYSPVVESQDELIKAKLVVFADDRFAYATEFHRFPVVTDLMRGEESTREIPRTTVDGFNIGDYILFQESNKDIIREVADRGLSRDNHFELRTVAGIWREALRDTFHQKASGKMDDFIGLLKAAGCGRHPATIRNWLYDDNQIGPGESSDLRRIAKAIDNRELLDRSARLKQLSLLSEGHIFRLRNSSENY